MAGIIPLNLVDILCTPPVTKEPTKHITGARNPTANEYYEWLQGEEKKTEAAELKQKKLEERQQKKKKRKKSKSTSKKIRIG